MKALILSLAGLAVYGGMLGCETGKAAHDERMQTIKELREMGLKGKARLVIIYGGGHIAGQAFNLSGSNGIFEADVSIDPAEQPTTQPVTP